MRSDEGCLLMELSSGSRSGLKASRPSMPCHAGNFSVDWDSGNAPANDMNSVCRVVSLI